jgi:1-acyl-sn-glycerol-3-phosphate acyltransferase
VLAFPEGTRGASKPVSERYRLRRFEDAAFIRTAVSAGVPIVPIAILGAEEAVPVLARVPSVFRRLRLPLAPVLPLPAKFKVRFLEPVHVDSHRTEDAQIQALSEDIRGLIQENLLEMVAGRRSAWLG